MGREIRKVPANWNHPKWTAEDAPHPRRIGDCIPLFEDYESALKEFAANIEKMGLSEAIEYGGAPSKADYVDFEGQPAEWVQVYETVSEGTPVTPPFATKEELVDYLSAKGDFWDQRRGDGPWTREQAERFVESEWSPSFIGNSSGLHPGHKLSS